MRDKEFKALIELIRFHIQKHRNLTERDVYKLLYQGTMGPKHLLGNPEAAKQYLQQEWETVMPDKDEPLTEPVSTDGHVVRVNLRPCKHLTGNYLLLWDALLQTALKLEEDHELFKKTWREFYQLVKVNRLPFSIKKTEELEAQVKQNNYPALHHSREYNITNNPAYRIILKSEFEKMNNHMTQNIKDNNE